MSWAWNLAGVLGDWQRRPGAGCDPVSTLDKSFWPCYGGGGLEHRSHQPPESRGQGATRPGLRKPTQVSADGRSPWAEVQSGATSQDKSGHLLPFLQTLAQPWASPRHRRGVPRGVVLQTHLRGSSL